MGSDMLMRREERVAYQCAFMDDAVIYTLKEVARMAEAEVGVCGFCDRTFAAFNT